MENVTHYAFIVDRYFAFPQSHWKNAQCVACDKFLLSVTMIDLSSTVVQLYHVDVVSILCFCKKEKQVCAKTKQVNIKNVVKFKHLDKAKQWSGSTMHTICIIN